MQEARDRVGVLACPTFWLAVVSALIAIGDKIQGEYDWTRLCLMLGLCAAIVTSRIEHRREVDLLWDRLLRDDKETL